MLMNRTLSAETVEKLSTYLESGGGRGLAVALEMSPDEVIDEVVASGLRARGGAGAACGPKWRTVRSYGFGAATGPTVVINAAEGEPGSYKDREIFLRNPYSVLEGAVIAARAVGAADVILATKKDHGRVHERATAAIADIRAAGWLDDLAIKVFHGPNEYLYGEETAMLEAIDGRPPFPRIAPPFRRGVHEVLDLTDGAAPTASAAPVELAGPSPQAVGAPTLVNNVETLANIPWILSEGAEWFGATGTDESPGTIVCTVSGACRRDGVGEVTMGTTIREVLELIGGGARPGHTIKAVMGGAATPLLTGDELDTPVSNEDMKAIGARLGCGSFMVFDDATDMVAVAEGVARFLSVESCGLCVPCKQDGLELAELFGRVRRSEADRRVIDEIRRRLDSVDEGARCALASQYQLVLGSILDRFGDEIEGHIEGRMPAGQEEFVASVIDLRDQKVILDEDHRRKQPNWTYDERWKGEYPADRLQTSGIPSSV